MNVYIPYIIPHQSLYDSNRKYSSIESYNDNTNQESQDSDTNELLQTLQNSADYYVSNSNSDSVQQTSNQIKDFGLAVQKWEFGNTIRGESHIGWLQSYKNINDAPGLKLSQSA